MIKEFFKKMLDCILVILYIGVIIFGIVAIFKIGVVIGLGILAVAALAIPGIKWVFKDLTSACNIEGDDEA